METFIDKDVLYTSLIDPAVIQERIAEIQAWAPTDSRYWHLGNVLVRRYGYALEFQKRRYADQSHIHLSEVFKCHTQRKEKVKFPDKGALVSIEPAVINGIVFEAGLGSTVLENKWHWHDDAKEPSKTKKIGRHTIIGNYDFRGNGVTSPGNEMIECKHPISLKDEPNDHYVQQCRGYLWLFKDHPFYHTDAEGVRHGPFYIDTLRLWEFAGDGFRETIIDDPWTDSEVLAILDNERSPVFDRECRFCPLDIKIDCPFVKPQFRVDPSERPYKKPWVKREGTNDERFRKMFGDVAATLDAEAAKNFTGKRKDVDKMHPDA